MSCSRRSFLGTTSAAVAAMIVSGLAGGEEKTVRSTASSAQSPRETEVVAFSALELSVAIRNKQVSCVEVMQAYLAHIDTFNPKFNAIVSMRDYSQLMEEAQLRDRELSRGEYHGWMHGFPHAAKDLADATGLLTSLGSPLFKENIAHSDSIHVERIKKSGAIIIGKTNVPEFGLGSQTYNPVFGTTLNAYDGVSTAGGSSGGAAVALALKMLPVADGSDLMGSLRNPAAFNNVIGFRPTPGRVPLSGMYIEELPCNGPMGRDVRDTAMLLSTIAGYHSAAPTSLKQDSTQFAQTLKSNVTGTRIGWLGDFDGYLPMEEGVMDVCEKGLKAFSDIGCEVDKAKLGYPMEQLWATWLTFRHWLVLGKVGPLYRDPKKRPLLKPEAIWEAQGGLNLRADDVYQASVARSQWYKALLGAFEHYDFLVLPTAQVFPFDANTHWPKEIAGKTMDTYHRWMEVVVPGTLSGCPVINVPAGFGKGGLPMGLQIIGRRHADLAVLKIAYAYEQASRWNSTHSPRFL
ncbi:MAG: amidase [Halioglobus sp.]|jgi:amidase